MAFIQVNMVVETRKQRAEKQNDENNEETVMDENLQHQNGQEIEEGNEKDDSVSNCDLLQESISNNTILLKPSEYEGRKSVENQFHSVLTTQVKQTVQYPTLKPSEFLIDDPALNEYIGIKARNKIHNETTHDVLHKEPLVSKKPPDQKSKNNNSNQMKIGDEYIIEKKFEKTDDDELSVEKGDRVLLKEIHDSWCKVESLRYKTEGFVPCENILLPGGNISNCTQWIFKHLINTYYWIINLPFPWKIALLVLLIALPLMPCLYVFKDSSSNKMEVDTKIDELEDKYKNLPDDIWSTLSYCLESTLNGKQPCIILMLNGGEENFSILLNDIGDLSVELVKGSLNDMKASKYLLKGSTITKSEENYSFEHYKNKLKENKVLLIDELEMVPGKIMENFHSLCDVYDAAVKQAVIVFLLNYKHITVDLNDEIKDATLAINILSDLWKNSIHHDLINPLAIRVAENVLHLQQKS